MSERRFYTDSTDKRGHSSSRRVAFPPMITSAVDALVASGKFPPYKTFSDVARDALVHLLEDLNDTDCSGQFALQVIAMEAERIEAEVEDTEALIERLKKSIRAGTIEREKVAKLVLDRVHSVDVSSPALLRLRNFLTELEF